MQTEVRWERLFPQELEERFARRPLVVFPYGLCEPHGPHNAVGLDALKAHGIACRFAAEYGGIVAPVDYWHVHEHAGYASWSARNVGEVERSWLTSVPAWHHFKSVLYHVRAAGAIGFHAAIFLTGHYGPNWKDLKTLLSILQPHFRMRLYGLPDFEANVPGFDGDGHSGGDHAGKVETSLLWALEPESVDISRLPDSDESIEGRPAWANPPFFAMGPNASESSRQTGERMVEDEIRSLTVIADRLLSEYSGTADARGVAADGAGGASASAGGAAADAQGAAGHTGGASASAGGAAGHAEPGSARPAGSATVGDTYTFEEVEAIWEKEVKPVLHTFASVSDFHADIGPPPEGSVWQSQYRIENPNR